jgi:hypothetical protein
LDPRIAAEGRQLNLIDVARMAGRSAVEIALMIRVRIPPGANPTTSNYNDGAVNIYNATNIIARLGIE